MAVNTTKKKSVKNRVKGFFSKIGSRFSRKKTAQQANKNFTKSIDVDELNQQTKELKNLLQRQVENAGNLNMDQVTKQVVQNNIETTRKLIEARQQELTNRGEKEKLEQLKKNIESVGNVVKNAPSASASPASSGNRLGNVTNLKVAAINALKRMSGMDSVAAQIEALRNVIKECCKDGAACGRNRSGSVSSVNSNNRGAENAELNELAAEANSAYAATLANPRANASNAAAPKGRANFLEPNVKKGTYPKGAAPPTEAPSPAGLYGSNNFENEPPRANKPNNKANNVSPAGLFGSNNFEEEPEAAPEPSAPGENNNSSSSQENLSIRGKLLKRLSINASASDSEIASAFRKASANAARSGTRNSNNYKSLTSMYANWRNFAKESAYKEGNRPAEEMNYASEQVNEAAARAAADEAEMETRAAAARAASPPANNKASSLALLGSNNKAKNNASSLALLGSNNNAKNNASSLALLGSNNFEEEPSRPSKSGRLPKPTMNNLNDGEKERVRLFKNLNSSITNNNALNLIRNEREQTASRTKKGGRRTQRKKRSVSRKKNNRKKSNASRKKNNRK